MLDLEQEKLNILTSSLEQRKKEVLYYQINIDNYTKALSLIEEKYSDRDDLQSFVDQLNALLESSILEQTKEKIMLEVIEDQLSAY